MLIPWLLSTEVFIAILRLKQLQYWETAPAVSKLYRADPRPFILTIIRPCSRCWRLRWQNVPHTDLIHLATNPAQLRLINTSLPGTIFYSSSATSCSAGYLSNLFRQPQRGAAVLLINTNENMLAFANGFHPNIIKYIFAPTFGMVAARAHADPLLIAIFISRQKSAKQVCASVVGAGLFNITNEPVMACRSCLTCR